MQRASGGFDVVRVCLERLPKGGSKELVITHTTQKGEDKKYDRGKTSDTGPNTQGPINAFNAVSKGEYINVQLHALQLQRAKALQAAVPLTLRQAPMTIDNTNPQF